MEVILFGYGRAGQIHYKNIMENKNYKLSGVVDAVNVSSKIDQDVEFIYDTDIEKINILLDNNNIKAVIVATPTRCHYYYIMLSLKKNKHVFVEKPVADDIYQINECFDYANKNNLILFVGYTRRYDPTIMAIKESVDNNKIGKINYVLTISRDYPYPQENFLKICSGIFHDCATHDIDYVNWIIKDKPISVYVAVESNVNIEEYNYNHVLINLNYSSGTVASLNLSRVSSSYDQRCEFYGDKGELINNIYDPRSQYSFPERYNQAFKKEIEEFYNCIMNNKSPIVTKDECIVNFIIAEACQESIDKNRKITIKYGKGFRDYDLVSKSISNNYFMARKYQTVEFVKSMIEKFSNFDTKIGIWDILEDLNNLVDVSDPDCSHPNLYHAIQTAEMIRKDGHPDWLQLIGLIHDMGKIMYLKGNDSDGTGKGKQWAMVGDTFIVGCKLSDKIIFSEYNSENLDIQDDRYNSDLGIYKEQCGLDNLMCSWGHDEYLYRILKSEKNQNNLPEEALYIIRFHSLYLYHDKQEYFRFQSEKDKNFFTVLKLFNKYDLYSKSDEIHNIEQLMPYYINLINKYFKNSYLYI